MPADEALSFYPHTIREQIYGKSRHGEENKKDKQVGIFHQLEVEDYPGKQTQRDEINADDNDRK